MIRERKVWGERWILRRTTSTEASILFVLAGRRCSWHRHTHKCNLFTILSGRIGIKTGDGEAILRAGEEFTVEPGVWHEFRAYEPSTMVEVMYVEYDAEDIERQNEGGRFQPEEARDDVAALSDERVPDNGRDAEKAAPVVREAKGTAGYSPFHAAEKPTSPGGVRK